MKACVFTSQIGVGLAGPVVRPGLREPGAPLQVGGSATHYSAR